MRVMLGGTLQRRECCLVSPAGGRTERHGRKFQRTPLLAHFRLTRREHRIDMWPREAGARMPEHGHAADRQGFDSIMLPRRMLGEREAPSEDNSALHFAAIESTVDGCWNLLSIMSRLFKTLPCQPCLVSCISQPTLQKGEPSICFKTVFSRRHFDTLLVIPGRLLLIWSGPYASVDTSFSTP
ncbi:hypothetical protein TgHK011_000294 [Trichoderma gracile]|nr:hypothetical protein TgHK011_000294 [Trichoderma gracile]